MDFYSIREDHQKDGTIDVYPAFIVAPSKDLMIRGGKFYAVWNPEVGLWSTSEYDVARLVDQGLKSYSQKLRERKQVHVTTKFLRDYNSGSWRKFQNYVKDLSDSYTQLDEDLTFANSEVNKASYASKRLPYPLEDGPFEAYDQLVSTLYDEEERAKIEWAIGAVVAGKAKHIQKFVVFYGAPGSGKGTAINIITRLFEGYYSVFEAKALTSSSNSFSTEAFKSNPLVGIQHDGDLSRVEDNTKLNSIVSHEEMLINEKFKSGYMSRINAFLFMGTNKPVKITDAKSGITRRLIDVHPSGGRVSAAEYHALVSRIEFELGGIAWHCLQVFNEMGIHYYDGYRPVEMMLQTDVFFNFVEDSYAIFSEQEEGVSLKQAYEMYKLYCSDTKVEHVKPQYRFREELKNYFQEFQPRGEIRGERVRSVYRGFKADKFATMQPDLKKHEALTLDKTESLVDDILSESQAQYANQDETPKARWVNVTTSLKDLDTTQVHYVRPPENHIVIDFDLKDSDGKKSKQRNLKAAFLWPETYAEFSKGGSGVHLHYIYDGDVSELSRIYDTDIEVKVFTGKSSLRRRLTKCNDIPIATINSGLPLKEKRMINSETVKSERSLRDLILRNLSKEIHPGTKPSIDFIHKILEDAYSSELSYDVKDLRGRILTFANNSSNHALYCVKRVADMKFMSEEMVEATQGYKSDRNIFYDVEVFPNLFVVCWKYEGDPNITRMINPQPVEIEKLVQERLVGFNCRRYDNHILYARLMGYSNEQLYKLSQRIIKNDRSAYFMEAYAISYADIYDFSNKKQGLKKWEIELGIHHQELGLPWDEPVPEEKWDLVASYCENDVSATEAVWNARKDDFEARQILADLSGLTVNDTTQKHTAKIIFGDDKNASDKFNYTELSEMFPGYVYEGGVSTYREEEVGEGGYVYAEPGIHKDVALLDVASMHPTSLILLSLFGPYTGKFNELLEARLAIKRGEHERAAGMLGGVLRPYLRDDGNTEGLAYALKIVINIVYGLTSAKFDNAFRDLRNKDNIVAKRGALFMIDLKHAVQEQGFTVAHIKTDSIKIPDATPEIVQFVMDFGKEYGYTFEHEDTYSKMCLVNNAVYAAYSTKHNSWETVGAQYQHPVVYKTLFTDEPLTFDDYCETKGVSTAIFLNTGTPEERELTFVGKTGRFVPVDEEKIPGGYLLRQDKEDKDKFHAVSGTSEHKWLEADAVSTNVDDPMEVVDRSYSTKLIDSALDNLKQYGDVESFLS